MPFASLLFVLLLDFRSCTGLVSGDKIPQVITRFYLSPHSPPTFEVMLTRFGSLISPYVPLSHQSGSALWLQLCNTYGHPEGSAVGDITIIWNDVFKQSVDCAHPFLSLFIFFCHHHHMECLHFSDLRIFSLSVPLCEWFSSTPFLLLVYYICIYCARETKKEPADVLPSAFSVLTDRSAKPTFSTSTSESGHCLLLNFC